MRLPGRRRWILWRLERGLRRSDPHLAAMLAIFARLAAGEAITSIEQRIVVRRWIRCGLAGLGRVLAAAAARWVFPPRAVYIASLMPRRMSQVLTGQAVKNPAIMPSCMRNQ